ncbi:MAG: BatA domain-containing protein [Thermoguttaceae bacterium]
MLTFVHPFLLWGLLLVGLPVLIHLINMLRHRPVQWAAMEFLLASQKKRRRRILMKQLILLLLRMLVIAAVVLLAAQPLMNRQLSGMLGGAKTHHVILLDDSFSMSDRWDETSAFEQAKRVIKQIGADASRRAGSGYFTLLPFSHAEARQGTFSKDLIHYPLGDDFADKLANLLKHLEVSQTAVGPLEALRRIDRILSETPGERNVLYILSDFRSRQWKDPSEIKKILLKRQTASNDKIRLINCIERVHSNLALESLAVEPGIRAAGVPWFMDVAVANFSKTPLKNVSVALSEDGRPRPGVIINEIPPGQTRKERFQVNFPSAGSHRITARLQGDAVEADNYRYYTVDLPVEVSLLMIDGEAQASNSQFLAMAASPGTAVRTGLRPQIEMERFLALKPLDGFAAIIVSNVQRLDQSAVRALEKYVAAGGGTAFFLGDLCQASYFNKALYRDGKGLFPLPLKGKAELPIERLEKSSDVQIERHFIFRIFADRRDSFLQTVIVERYFSVLEDWKPSPDSGVRVIARLRNGAPLVVEKTYGKGKVVAFLTTAAPTWNNWARNPTFVVLCQDLAAYLSERTNNDRSRLVGEPLKLTLDLSKYQTPVRFLSPRDPALPLPASESAPSANGKFSAVLNETDTAGVYQACFRRGDNSQEMRCFAYNVDPAEGDLSAMDKTQLADRLKQIKYEYEQASMYHSAREEIAGNNLSDFVLYALLALLIVEQIFAWSASYHPTASIARRSAGGGR